MLLWSQHSPAVVSLCYIIAYVVLSRCWLDIQKIVQSVKRNAVAGSEDFGRSLSVLDVKTVLVIIYVAC